MDYLRSCYKSNMRLYSDRPDVLVPGQWYFCPPGAIQLPFQHSFGSASWCPTGDDSNPSVGEIGSRGAWVNGRCPPQYNGQHWCGSLEAWQNGIPYADRPGLDLDPWGYPVCCHPAAGGGGQLAFNAEYVDPQLIWAFEGDLAFKAQYMLGAPPIFLDTFTGTAGTGVPPHAPNIGGPWIPVIGTFELGTGGCVPVSDTLFDCIRADLGVSDFHLTALVTGEGTSPSDYQAAAVMFRWNDSGDYLVVAARPVVNQLSFQSVVGGSFSLLALVTTPIVPNIQYTIDVICAGSQVSISLNGALLIGPMTVTDCETYTSIGIQVVSDGTAFPCSWRSITVTD